MVKRYAIELDGHIYNLSGQNLAEKNRLQDIQGCRLLVTDFENSISRVMQVASDIKYAQAMVARTLQNEGEFDEPVSVITHWKKKRGKKNSEIFFTALPTRIYLQYLDRIEGHDDIVFMTGIFAVLGNLIQKIAPEDPVAVVFRHERFADLVIGKKNQFFFATQCVAFDTQNKQIDTLWETISREIENAVRENSINLKQLVCLNWIDIANDIPETSFPEITRYIFESEPITHEGKIFHVSFIRAVTQFPVFKAITHEKGRLIYCAEKISPFIITFLIAATIMFSFGAFSLRSKTKSLEKNIVSIEKRMQILNRSVSFQIKDNNPLPTLEFIDSIFSSSNLPSYKDIVNDISMGTSPAFTMEQLQARYLDRQVKISLKGVIHADFDKAYKGYQNLLSSLLTNGYEIEHNIFMTQIHSSRFELELLWRIR